MPELFDIVLWLLIILAFALSKMPKQLALAICAFGLLQINLMNYWTEVGVITLPYIGVVYEFAERTYAHFYNILFIEGCLVLFFLAWSKRLVNESDRFFMQAMAGMFVLSYAITIFRAIKVTPHDDYVLFSEIAAGLHVFLMLWLSDKGEQFAGYISSLVSGSASRDIHI